MPALAGAHLLTGEDRYAEHAVVQLRAWFVDPATRMTPRLDFGSVLVSQAPARDRRPGLHRADQLQLRRGSSSSEGGRFQGILETLPLVEIAQAIPFLAASAALSEADLKALHAWFAAYLRWLTEPRTAGRGCLRWRATARTTTEPRGCCRPALTPA